MSAILDRGYVPKYMLKSVIIPIIKNKNKCIRDKDDYRHICLANVFTKVVLKVLYSRRVCIYNLRLINLSSSENMGQKCVFLF